MGEVYNDFSLDFCRSVYIFYKQAIYVRLSTRFFGSGGGNVCVWERKREILCTWTWVCRRIENNRQFCGGRVIRCYGMRAHSKVDHARCICRQTTHKVWATVRNTISTKHIRQNTCTVLFSQIFHISTLHFKCYRISISLFPAISVSTRHILYKNTDIWNMVVEYWGFTHICGGNLKSQKCWIWLLFNLISAPSVHLLEYKQDTMIWWAETQPNQTDSNNSHYNCFIIAIAGSVSDTYDIYTFRVHAQFTISTININLYRDLVLFSFSLHGSFFFFALPILTLFTLLIDNQINNT